MTCVIPNRLGTSISSTEQATASSRRHAREKCGFTFGSLERRCMRHGHLRSPGNAKQLLPLHDEVHQPDDESGQQQRQPVESIPGSASGAHEQTRHAGRHFVEDKRPRHVQRAVRRGQPSVNTRSGSIASRVNPSVMPGSAGKIVPTAGCCSSGTMRVALGCRPLSSQS